MIKLKIFIFLFAILIFSPIVSAAHWVAGYVKDAYDGASANGHTVILWNPANGMSDNVTDIIGPSGNSGTNNWYMIDCERLNTKCKVGNQIRVKVLNNGNNRTSYEANATVSGGVSIMQNLTLSSPPSFSFILLDDSTPFPQKEIDLSVASTTPVYCQGVVFSYQGDNSLINISAVFYDYQSTTADSVDDNNNHYTNNSCIFDKSYGNENETYFNCSFNVHYYANSSNWNCSLFVYDNLSVGIYGRNNTYINPLLAIGLPSTIDFGLVNATRVSAENRSVVINFGNVPINLTLSGYAIYPGDNLSMNCTHGLLKNISIGYTKYNLTGSNDSQLTYEQFNSLYLNLTSANVPRRFDLIHRINDLTNDASKPTYWRIYVPTGVAGNCTGKIVFGAVQSPGG